MAFRENSDDVIVFDEEVLFGIGDLPLVYRIDDAYICYGTSLCTSSIADHDNSYVVCFMTGELIEIKKEYRRLTVFVDLLILTLKFT